MYLYLSNTYSNILNKKNIKFEIVFWRKPIYFMWFPIKLYDLINVLWYTPVVGIYNTTKKISFIIVWPWDLNHIDVNVVYKTCTKHTKS